MNIEILRANIADSAGIAHVQIESYRSAYAPFFPSAYLEHFTYAEQTQDWRELLSDANRGTVFVAVRDARETIGYALVQSDTEELEQWEGELVALHVLPEFQKQGVGRQLFLIAAQELAARGKTVLYLWTLEGNPIRAWYERLGGKLTGEKEYDVDEVTVTEVAYGWRDIDTLIQNLARTNGA